MKVHTAYDITDKVTIDRDESICGTVTAICLRGTGLNVTYEISYMHNGNSYCVWVEEWRINRWGA